MNPDYECIEEVMAVAAPMHPDYESTEVIATTAAAMYPDYHSSEEDVRHRGPGFARIVAMQRVCVCVCVLDPRRCRHCGIRGIGQHESSSRKTERHANTHTDSGRVGEGVCVCV